MSEFLSQMCVFVRVCMCQCTLKLWYSECVCVCVCVYLAVVVVVWRAQVFLDEVELHGDEDVTGRTVGRLHLLHEVLHADLYTSDTEGKRGERKVRDRRGKRKEGGKEGGKKRRRKDDFQNTEEDLNTHM